MQREHAIRQLAKREGYRLEKKGDDSYRLINARFNGFWDLIGKRTIGNLKLQAGAKVLDVGCGTGASALPAAQTVGKTGSRCGSIKPAEDVGLVLQ